MHILTRRSSTESTSHAEAWQTTSRSRGCTNWERCQNVVGQGRESERLEEVFAVVNHVAAGGELRGVAGIGAEIGARDKGGRGCGIFLGDLLLECRLEIERLELGKLGIGGRNDVVDVAPLLGPHVAQ